MGRGIREDLSEPAAILGLSFDYHDAAAAVVVGGELVAAAAEERFTRTKHDASVPANALSWCLDHAGISPGAPLLVAFYEKPMTKLERVLRGVGAVRPGGLPAMAGALARWGNSKLWVGARIEAALAAIGHPSPRIVYAEHHLSHAASAFYPSPFERAAILTFDGVGEWATSSIGWGAGHRIELRETLAYPDSLGLLFSAMTDFCGFDVNDGEYKLMGLAPYGEPRYVDALLDRVVHLHADGSVRLDLRYFGFPAGRRMAGRRLDDLLDGPPRHRDDPPGQREADIARSTQVVLEEAVLRVARHARSVVGEDVACLAGGVALNCVANQRLRESGVFSDIWVQPAAGDDGGAVGAALWAHHQVLDRPRPTPRGDAMSGAFLGPAYTQDEVAAWLAGLGVPHETFADHAATCGAVAAELAAGSVVGWFQGRMEFGPRALGHRSILADPRDPGMVARLNAKVKRREGFRPFAPAVLEERAGEWFATAGPLPYMTETALVHPDRLVPADPDPGPQGFAAQLRSTRSTIPACTHLDLTARVQTVTADANPELHRLLEAFERLTGCPVLVNTSFNRAGEPIVCTPADALRCFADTDLDLLVIERCLVRASDLAALDVPAVAEVGAPGPPTLAVSTP